MAIIEYCKASQHEYRIESKPDRVYKADNFCTPLDCEHAIFVLGKKGFEPIHTAGERDDHYVCAIKACYCASI
jgi:hypothetical protein